MERKIITINEEKCNGCGLCVPNCHEGALQIIDGKARLISDLMCDGLGACLGHCAEGALTIEEREAENYNEAEVMNEMAGKGKNVVIAHLKHLKEHNELAYLQEGVKYLKENENSLAFNLSEVINVVHNYHPGLRGGNHSVHAASQVKEIDTGHHVGGCPGSMTRTIPRDREENAGETGDVSSMLTHWPVQLHLINPDASHFAGSDLLLAADCVAFSMGNFHQKFLKGKTLAIACPKLDSNKDVYVQKLIRLIEHAGINTITVMKMEVPCCGGLLQTAHTAAHSAKRKIPVKSVTIGIQGTVLREEWIL